MKNAIYSTKEDIAEVKLLTNRTVPETNQQKADMKNELRVLAADVVEDLKLEIGKDLTRVRRAFYEEKSFLKLEVKNLRSSMTEFDKTLQESLQSMETAFQNLSQEMTFRQETNLKFINQSVDESISTMVNSVRDSVQDIEHIVDSKLAVFESSMSSINRSVNGSISTMVMSVSESIQDIEHIVDNKMDDAATSMSMCKTAIDTHDNKINVHFKNLSQSLFPDIIESGYLYPLNGDGKYAYQASSVIRLANTIKTTNAFFGRLEVKYGDDWGTVCDDSFTHIAATVACRMLGFFNGIGFHSAQRGYGSGDILLDDVICQGSETSIFDCQHQGIRQHNCGHHEDVSVKCQI